MLNTYRVLLCYREPGEGEEKDKGKVDGVDNDGEKVEDTGSAANEPEKDDEDGQEKVIVEEKSQESTSSPSSPVQKPEEEEENKISSLGK